MPTTERTASVDEGVDGAAWKDLPVVRMCMCVHLSVVSCFCDPVSSNAFVRRGGNRAQRGARAGGRDANVRSVPCAIVNVRLMCLVFDAYPI